MRPQPPSRTSPPLFIPIMSRAASEPCPASSAAPSQGLPLQRLRWGPRSHAVAASSCPTLWLAPAWAHKPVTLAPRLPPPPCRMAGQLDDLRRWVLANKLKAVFGFWATGLSVSMAYQWTRPIPTQLKIIHSRMYAQASGAPAARCRWNLAKLQLQRQARQPAAVTQRCSPASPCRR